MKKQPPHTFKACFLAAACLKEYSDASLSRKRHPYKRSLVPVFQSRPAGPGSKFPRLTRTQVAKVSKLSLVHFSNLLVEGGSSYQFFFFLWRRAERGRGGPLFGYLSTNPPAPPKAT